MTGTEQDVWLSRGEAAARLGVSGAGDRIYQWIRTGKLVPRPRVIGPARVIHEVRAVDLDALAALLQVHARSGDMIEAGEASRMLGMSRQALSGLRQRGRIQAVLTRAYGCLYRRADVEALIAARANAKTTTLGKMGVCKALGVDRRSLARLVRCGFLAQLPVDPAGRFDCGAVERLRRQLYGEEAPDGYISHADAAKLAGYSQKYVRRLLWRKGVKLFRHLRTKSARYYRRSDVEAALAAHRAPKLPLRIAGRLTTQEASHALSVERSTLRRWRAAGLIRARRVKYRDFYDEVDIALLKKRLGGGAGAYSGLVSAEEAAALLGVRLNYLPIFAKKHGLRWSKPHGRRCGARYYDVGKIEELVFSRGTTRAATIRLGYADSVLPRSAEERIALAHERQRTLKPRGFR